MFRDLFDILSAKTTLSRNNVASDCPFCIDCPALEVPDSETLLVGKHADDNVKNDVVTHTYHDEMK